MYFLHLSLSSVILIDSSTGSPVHVLMLSIHAVRGLRGWPCHLTLARTSTQPCHYVPAPLIHNIYTHTHTQPFDGPLSGTTRVDRYQKKHSHTRTHPDHQTSFINFLHLVHSTCHLIFFPYRPGITSMQHAASHTTTVQPSAHNQRYIVIGKQWYQLPELFPAHSCVCAVVLVYVMCSYISRTSIHTLQRSSLVHTDAVSIHCFVLCVVFSALRLHRNGATSETIRNESAPIQ